MLTVMVLLCSELLKTFISWFSIMKREAVWGYFLRYVPCVDLASFCDLNSYMEKVKFAKAEKD